jgi:nucleoid-associated protein YgaU
MYRAKGGRFMTRSQGIAVFLAAVILAAGVAYAWRQGMSGPPRSATASAPASLMTAGTPVPAPAAANPMMASSSMMASSQMAKQQAASSATPPETVTPQPANPGPDIPMFDTVRVEPSGDTVVAGHGEPDAKFALLSGDKVLSEIDADGAGNFVMVPPPLAPGNYSLALRSTGKDGTVLESQQNIAVSVPPKGQTNVVVALAEPGKPSVVLTDTASKPEPSSAPPASGAPMPPQVTFKTAEVDNGGFYASGTATPGAHLRVYLNGSALADVAAGDDGHWSLTVGKGITPGHFAVRADLIDDTGKVLARAEVPFDVPVSVAAADSANSAPSVPDVPDVPSATQTKPGAEQTATAPRNSGANDVVVPQIQTATAPRNSGASDVVVPQIQTATVIRGDSLWRISRKVFGHGIRYTLIYEANASQIRDPSLIYPGQVFVLPHMIN